MEDQKYIELLEKTIAGLAAAHTVALEPFPQEVDLWSARQLQLANARGSLTAAMLEIVDESQYRERKRRLKGIEPDYLSNTHQWRWMSQMLPGDFIHRWGDDLEIKSIERHGPCYFLTIIEAEGRCVTWGYEKDGQFICKRRE